MVRHREEGALTLGKKKSKTTSQETATTTPNVPDWLLQPAPQLTGNLTNLINTPSSTFAPAPGQLQKQAWDQASKLQTSSLLNDGAELAKGADYTPGAVQGESLLSGLQNYFNPYQKEVIDSTIADLDENAGQVRAAQAAQAAGTGSFRGSRYGFREAQTEGQLSRARGSTLGNLRSSGFDRATSLSADDANRRQQAATTSAQLREQAEARRLQGAGLLSDIGRSNLGALDEAGRQQTLLDTAAKQFPLEYQKQLEGLFAGLNPGMFTGQTINSSGTSTSKSSGGFLGDLAMALGGAYLGRK